MSDPITFPTNTPAIGLPLLVAGQAQKEFFVNQSLCMLDALHGRTVLASLPAPPATAADGECFRVTGPATAAWAEYEDRVAVMIGGDWHFISPQDGMHIFDKAAGHTLVFRSTWETANAPVSPSGGSVIDAEARAAIGQLVLALQTIGVLNASGG